MATVQKISGSQISSTKVRRMAIIQELARRYANRIFGTYVPAKSDQLGQFAEDYVRTRHVIQRVMERRYPKKYISWDI